MLSSLRLLQPCPRLVTTTQLVRLLATTPSVNRNSKYTVPMRTVMLKNEEMRGKIDAIKTRVGGPQVKQNDIFFENRNPRYMELMGMSKPTGFSTLYEKRNFFNKLHLELTNQHTKAYVENINGQIICFASTTEHALAKRLHSSTDVSAVVNVARVLAERLKRIGVLRVDFHVRYSRATEKVREFEGILERNGIILSELPERVLEGRPQTLPPKKEKRTLPIRMSTRMKKWGCHVQRKPKTRH